MPIADSSNINEEGLLDLESPSLTRASSQAVLNSFIRSQDANPSVQRNIGYPTALTNFDFPIEMNSSVHMLLEHYLTHAPRRLYPLESCLKSNPLRAPEWFHYAIRDAAMLHGMLYAGSLYLALLEGRTESKDTLHHLSHVISIVNQRLREPGQGVEDSTIGAISCVALGEVRVSILPKIQLTQNCRPLRGTKFYGRLTC